MLIGKWNWLTDNKMRLATKIFWVSFLLFESILLLLGYFYYRHSSETLVNAQSAYSRQLIQKSDSYLQMNLTNIQNFFLSVANDSRFQRDSFEELKSWLTDNLINFIPNAKHIHVIESNEVVVSTSAYSWIVLENPDFQKQLAMVTVDRRLYWTSPYFSTVSQYTVSAMMRIPSANGRMKILVIDLDLERLYDALFADKSSLVQGEMLILDRKGETVFGRKPYAQFDVFQRKFVLSGMEQVPLNQSWTSLVLSEAPSHNQLFIVRSQSNLMGWQLIWLMNQTELIKPIRQSLGYLWMLAGLSLLLTMGISVIVSILVSRPVLKIANSMGQVGKGNLHTTVLSTRKDELGLLAAHFNDMTSRIRKLIADLQHTEEEKKRLDFKALQTQIRPHFLYNTLHMISTVAKQGHLQEVDQLITLLTDQLQYSLDTSPSPVSLREELQAAESYVRLMSSRYMNQITLETDIDPFTLELPIPKFILQPILENSIFHGLVPSGVPGVVYVSTAIEGNHWEIYLEDNGVGMTETQVESLLLKLHATEAESPISGIGLRNVNKRLIHSYGDSYRMDVDSTAGTGTRVTLILPFPESRQIPSLLSGHR